MISVKLQIPEIQEFGVLLRPSIFYLPHLQTWTPSSLLGFPQKLFPVAWHPPSTPRRRTSKAIAAQRPIAPIRKSEVQRFFLHCKLRNTGFFQVFPGFYCWSPNLVDHQIDVNGQELKVLGNLLRPKKLQDQKFNMRIAATFPTVPRSKPSTAWWRIAEYVESRLKDQIDPPGHTDSHHH